MSNIIALVWDFDKTLVDGYMQDPIFEEYKVDSQAFWDEVNALPDWYEKEQDVRVNPDTVYLNHFIRGARDGIFKGLNNEKLKESGNRLKFYPGVPEIFEAVCSVVEEEKYKEHDIRVEHYVVSTGMRKVIEGSTVADHVKRIWGCDLIEEETPDGRVISEVGYTIDNTTKTRALFEINKGVGVDDREGITVNTSISEELRRVRFENMIYIADGPSDIPSFSVVKKNGGSTFGVYPKGNEKAMRQIERMREDGRIGMYAVADYSEGSTAYMWLRMKVRELADSIVEKERQKLKSESSSAPVHLV